MTTGVFSDRRASTFMEMALWMILFVLAIAPAVAYLAGVVADKFNQMAERVGGLGE